MNGVQLPQGYSHFEEAIYFLPLSSQTFLVLIPGSQSICSAKQLGCFYMIGGLLVNGLRAAPTNRL